MRRWQTSPAPPPTRTDSTTASYTASCSSYSNQSIMTFDPTRGVVAERSRPMSSTRCQRRRAPTALLGRADARKSADGIDLGINLDSESPTLAIHQLNYRKRVGILAAASFTALGTSCSSVPSSCKTCANSRPCTPVSTSCPWPSWQCSYHRFQVASSVGATRVDHSWWRRPCCWRAV